MYCSKCGNKMAEGSNFCTNCGARISSGETQGDYSKIMPGSNTVTPGNSPFVPARCTNCGAALEVNPNLEAAVCRFCNTPFIVQKAINNYNISAHGDMHIASATINFNGVNVDNLLKRAKDFEARGELRDALNYYERVLDINMDNPEAVSGSRRVRNAIQNYVYFESDANLGFNYGKLQLRRGVLTYISNNQKKRVDYDIGSISDLKVSLFTVLVFKYLGKFSDQSIGITGINASKWVELITAAQRGIYPNDFT